MEARKKCLFYATVYVSLTVPYDEEAVCGFTYHLDLHVGGRKIVPWFVRRRASKMAKTMRRAKNTL